MQTFIYWSNGNAYEKLENATYEHTGGYFDKEADCGTVTGVRVEGHTTSRLFQHSSTRKREPGKVVKLHWIPREAFDAGRFDRVTCG